MQAQTKHTQYTAHAKHTGDREYLEYLELNLERLDLTALADAVVRDCRATVQSHPLYFEGDGACPILGDRNRLKQVLLNLISSALKHSADGREVTVSVWQRGADVHLTVQDRGVGIAPANGERLFLPFKQFECACQLERENRRSLALVQKIVEAHGGDISVQGASEPGRVINICFKTCWRENEG